MITSSGIKEMANFVAKTVVIGVALGVLSQSFFVGKYVINHFDWTEYFFFFCTHEEKSKFSYNSVL